MTTQPSDDTAARIVDRDSDRPRGRVTTPDSAPFADLLDRAARAAKGLAELAIEAERAGNHERALQLNDKAAGVRLVISYIREAQRA